MTLCVVDSSAIGPMLFPDEAGDLIPDLIDRFADGSVLVPGHWPLEVASMLHNAVRRRRIGSEMRAEAIDLLLSFAVNIDDHLVERLWTDTLPLADRHGLTVYDAAYLELARRAGAVLATHDAALRGAALDEKIGLLGE